MGKTLGYLLVAITSVAMTCLMVGCLYVWLEMFFKHIERSWITFGLTLILFIAASKVSNILKPLLDTFSSDTEE